MKRTSKLGVDPLELPKKKQLVSKDGKEKSFILGAAGFQPLLVL